MKNQKGEVYDVHTNKTIKEYTTKYSAQRGLARMNKSRDYSIVQVN